MAADSTNMNGFFLNLICRLVMAKDDKIYLSMHTQDDAKIKRWRCISYQKYFTIVTYIEINHIQQQEHQSYIMMSKVRHKYAMTSKSAA